MHQTGVMHRFLAKAPDEGWDVVGAAADTRAASPISSSPSPASSWATKVPVCAPAFVARATELVAIPPSIDRHGAWILSRFRRRGHLDPPLRLSESAAWRPRKQRLFLNMYHLSEYTFSPYLDDVEFVGAVVSTSRRRRDARSARRASKALRVHRTARDSRARSSVDAVAEHLRTDPIGMGLSEHSTCSAIDANRRVVV